MDLAIGACALTHAYTCTHMCVYIYLEKVVPLIKGSKVNLLDFKMFSKTENLRFSAKNNLFNKSHKT